MGIDELVQCTNGLSVSSGTETFAVDRARITPLKDDVIEMSFWIAGTDYVPRLTLPRKRLDSGTPEELTAIVRRVARHAIVG